MTTPIAASQKKLTIVGGGITGLTAAYEAMQRGETNIHLYEANTKFGGKIQTGFIGNTPINQGAEFIDSDQKNMIALAKSLGVPLVENKGAANEEFQRPDGSILSGSDFYESYKPYAEQVQRDRAELQANPNSPRAQHLGSLSLEAYLAELGATTPLPNRSLWRWAKDVFHLQGNQAPTTLDIARGTYEAEMGRPATSISAASFITETSHELDSLLASDCALRVEGGTHKLIEKLQQKLAAGGVQFHTGAELANVAKQADGKLALGFKDPALNSTTDRVILALPANAIGAVQGLDALGLSAQGQALLRDTQYTKNIKLTVSFKPGQAPKDSTFFSSMGFQCWSPEPHLLTLLAEADALGQQKPKEFIMARLEAYAKAHGSTADQMFDFSPGKFNYNNPGNKPCYCSPKPGQAKALEALQHELPTLAQHGVGVAGTFLPFNGGVGFMECGVASAKRSIDLVLGQEKIVDDAKQKQWTQQIVAQRAAATNDATMAIRA